MDWWLGGFFIIFFKVDNIGFFGGIILLKFVMKKWLLWLVLVDICNVWRLIGLMN